MEGTDPRLTAPAIDPEPPPEVDNPVLTGADVDDISDVPFVADPFLCRVDGRFHLFFEVKSRRRKLFGLRSAPQFDIAHATSPDGRDWSYEGVVLPASQAEHTYPFVHRHDGEWYMTPAPAGRMPQEFRVYRADPFPDEWTLVDSALAGEVRIDPTPFRHEGTWYLCYQEAESFDIRLRHADSLVGGEWVEHPDSPLFTPGGNDVAPGGRPVVREGYVDLFFRRGTPGLVEHWRVTELSPDSLSMTGLPSSPVVAGTGEEGAWNGRNMHHVDAGVAVSSAADLVAVDGQDHDRDYRLGIYRDCQEETALLVARADGVRLEPGEATAPDWTVGTAVGWEDDLAVPADGHYRVALTVDLRGDGAGELSLVLRGGEEPLAEGSVPIATGEGRLTAGPARLTAGTPVGGTVAHDGPTPVTADLRLACWRCW
jgi:hypothetical protein